MVQEVGNGNQIVGAVDDDIVWAGDILSVAPNGLLKRYEEGEPVFGVALQTEGPRDCIWIREEYVAV